jgi:hypothetical protein
MMKTIFIFLMVIGLTRVNAQIVTDNFVGKWKCYHIELEDGNTGEDLTFDGKPYSCQGLVLELRSNKTGHESINDLEFTYSFQDSLVQIGSRVYKIEKLTTDEMILLDHNTSGLSFSFRQKFRKESSETVPN